MDNILDEYVRTLPVPQNAINLFSGQWTSRFPAELGLAAGTIPLFEDTRVSWLIQQANGVAGKRVLELGPLEGAHTSMLHSAGANVVAIEANSRAFLKCLITKEILNLGNVRFLLGDFGEYLETHQKSFDLILASGVLYHSTNPIRLLELLAAQGCPIGIWTHYFDREILQSRPELIRFFGDVFTRRFNGSVINLYQRNYLESLDWNGFCGGPEPSALWMDRDGLMSVLGSLGLNQITIFNEEPGHPNGPAMMLFAKP